MSERMYLVTWSVLDPRDEDWHRTIDDHFAALDDLDDAKQLYQLLYLHQEMVQYNKNHVTELRLIGQRFSYGTLHPRQEIRSLTLSVPMLAESYPCADAVIWNKSKGEGAPPNDLRFEELNAANGTHIFVHKREGQ